jgi:phosphoglycolate phosphatase-like HAD superfamily hydrolase
MRVSPTPFLFMQFRTFLFDLDGTLIEHLPAIHRAYAHTLPKLGLPAPTYAQVKGAIGGGLENAMRKFIPVERIPEALAIYRPYWDATMLDGVEAMPGALALLADLHARGAQLAVFTNKLGTSSRLICDHLGFSPYLSLTLGAQDTPWLKPDPAFTAHALTQLKADAATTLLVGDSPFDVQAAINAGFPCWAVTTGTHTAEQLQAAHATRIFSGLPEITTALSD